MSKRTKIYLRAELHTSGANFNSVIFLLQALYNSILTCKRGLEYQANGFCELLISLLHQVYEET